VPKARCTNHVRYGPKADVTALVPVISFSVFTAILIVGINLAEHRVTGLRERAENSGRGKDGQTRAKIFAAGALLN
jgi:hypothetical protein